MKNWWAKRESTWQRLWLRKVITSAKNSRKVRSNNKILSLMGFLRKKNQRRSMIMLPRIVMIVWMRSLRKSRR